MSVDRVKNLARLADIPGILLGIQVLLKGVDKLPYFHHHPLHISFFFLAGGFIVSGSFLHHLLEKRIKNVHALFHLLEGVALATSALLLFEKGKLRMPLILLFLGCMYVVLGLISYRMNEGNRERLGKRLIKWFGLAFIVAGLIALFLNLRHDRNPWVFVIAGLFLACGLFYFLFSNWIATRLSRVKPDRPGHAAETRAAGLDKL